MKNVNDVEKQAIQNKKNSIKLRWITCRVQCLLNHQHPVSCLVVRTSSVVCRLAVEMHEQNNREGTLSYKNCILVFAEISRCNVNSCVMLYLWRMKILRVDLKIHEELRMDIHI